MSGFRSQAYATVARTRRAALGSPCWSCRRRPIPGPRRLHWRRRAGRATPTASTRCSPTSALTLVPAHPIPGALFQEPSKGDPSWLSKPSYVSRYDQRVKLVANALTQNSKLTEDVAVELAKHVLDALDHIPEKVR